MRCSHDSRISSEIIYKYVVEMLSAPNPDQNSDVILSDVVCHDHSSIPSEILIRYGEQVLSSLKSYFSFYGFASDVTCLPNEFIPGDIPNERDIYASNEQKSSHTSDVIVSDVEKSHNQCASRRIDSQWYDKSEVMASFPEAAGEPVKVLQVFPV